MTISIKPSDQACGAEIRGLDLCQPLDDATIASIRAAWLKYHVLAFPEQHMTDDDLERFTTYFGPFGDDPFVQPIPGRKHIIAIQRSANERSSLFAESWHSDWSFQERPPAGTCLLGITIPPVGGDTLFVNQHKALAEMPAELRARIEGKVAVHSAAGAYAPEGLYGDNDADSGRSMSVVASEEARSVCRHPLVRSHPESGREGLFSCLGYIVGIDGMAEQESRQLLEELYLWQTGEQFRYVHQWQANTLLMWDNRSVLHCATGGYEGYDRLLHRTTIGSAV